MAAIIGGAWRKKYSEGKRRLRDAPLGSERDRTKADASNGESKRTQRRTSLLMLRRRGELIVTAAGGDGRGWLMSTMILLRVDVADLRYFNPKVQTDASSLVKVNFN